MSNPIIIGIPLVWGLSPKVVKPFNLPGNYEIVLSPTKPAKLILEGKYHFIIVDNGDTLSLWPFIPK